MSHNNPHDNHPAAASVRARMEEQRRAHFDAMADWTETAPDDTQLVHAILATELADTRPSQLLVDRLLYGDRKARFVHQLLNGLLDVVAEAAGDNVLDPPSLPREHLVKIAQRRAAVAANLAQDHDDE